MKEFIYRGCCYNTDANYPFGFCKECWIKHGKPEAMNGDTIAQ